VFQLGGAPWRDRGLGPLPLERLHSVRPLTRHVLNDEGGCIVLFLSYLTYLPNLTYIPYLI
jgi:hypothetical protein